MPCACLRGCRAPACARAKLLGRGGSQHTGLWLIEISRLLQKPALALLLVLCCLSPV